MKAPLDCYETELATAAWYSCFEVLMHKSGVSVTPEGWITHMQNALFDDLQRPINGFR